MYSSVANAKKLHFTFHAHDKMRHYRLSESRVKRVINSPLRIEEGIAPDTIAVMQPASILRSENGKPSEWNQEIWVMVQDQGSARKVISAWRYPGKTKERDPIPGKIWREMQALAAGK